MLGAMAALEIVDGVDVTQLAPYRPARFGPGGAGADGRAGVTRGGGGGREREEERGGVDERGRDGAKRSESAGGWAGGWGVGGGRIPLMTSGEAESGAASWIWGR